MMDLSFRSRKRGRGDGDEDEDEDVIRLAGVPAEKKQRNNTAFNFQLPLFLRDTASLRPSIVRSRTLPLRLDHSPPQPTPQLIEHHEGESPTDESSSNSPASFLSLPPPPDLGEMEMHMDHHASFASSTSPPSTYSHIFLRPDALHSPGLNQLSGRIPTPIHSNFTLAPPPPPAPRSRKEAYLPVQQPHHQSVTLPGLARPLKQRLENDFRMPSPIVEDSMEIADLPSSQLSRLSVSQDSMDLDDEHGGGGPVCSQHSSGSVDQLHNWDVPPTPSTPGTPGTPGRMGRARSGAFSSAAAVKHNNNNSSGGDDRAPQEAKGARKIVFGYREDCDKCRMRFPGHFAHFV